jgi:hypothetical protein
MIDNSVAAQIGTSQRQQPQNLLQTAMALQKLKQAFPANSSLANPVRPTAFNTDSGND